MDAAKHDQQHSISQQPPQPAQPEASTSTAPPPDQVGDEGGAAQDGQTGPGKKKTTAKVFRCNGFGECAMTFTRSEHLARHVRKHTGERPFKCHCGRTFSRLDNVRQHAATVHADHSAKNAATIASLVALHNSLSASTMQRQRDAGMIVHDPNAEPKPRKKRTANPDGAAAGGEDGSAGKKKSTAKKKGSAAEKKAQQAALEAAELERQRNEAAAQEAVANGQGGFAAAQQQQAAQYPYGYPGAPQYPGAIPGVPPNYPGYGAASYPYPGAPVPPHLANPYAMGMYGAPGQPGMEQYYNAYAQQQQQQLASAAFYPNQQPPPQQQEPSPRHRPSPLNTSQNGRNGAYPSPQSHSAGLASAQDGPLTPNKISLPSISQLLPSPFNGSEQRDGQQQPQQPPQQPQQAAQPYYAQLASQSRPPSQLGMPSSSGAPGSAASASYAHTPFPGSELQHQQQSAMAANGLYPPTIPGDPYARPGSNNAHRTSGGSAEDHLAAAAAAAMGGHYSHMYGAPPTHPHQQPYQYAPPPSLHPQQQQQQQQQHAQQQQPQHNLYGFPIPPPAAAGQPFSAGAPNGAGAYGGMPHGFNGAAGAFPRQPGFPHHPGGGGAGMFALPTPPGGRADERGAPGANAGPGGWAPPPPGPHGHGYGGEAVGVR
ncbi:hypothetical protein JCM10207_001827 [Rhodosporidiobolus poonsookiae]